MSENRIDRAVEEANEVVLRNLRRYDAEAEYARAERHQLTAADKAEMNEIIDEQREQDAIADADYADRMLERLDEERSDR